MARNHCRTPVAPIQNTVSEVQGQAVALFFRAMTLIAMLGEKRPDAGFKEFDTCCITGRTRRVDRSRNIPHQHQPDQHA
jgi:hypothetical protein